MLWPVGREAILAFHVCETSANPSLLNAANTFIGVIAQMCVNRAVVIIWNVVFTVTAALIDILF